MSRGNRPTVTVVIPAMNESRNLETVLPELPPLHEVLLVDGHSVDGTVDVARRLMPGIKIVRQTRRGKGNALACGFHAATGDIIVMFDADGSADPAEIPHFVTTLTCGFDFAKGSRFILGGGSHDITGLRNVGNASLNGVTNLLFRTRFSDLCYGYNAFWRDIVPVLDLPSVDQAAPSGAMPWGDGFEIETMINCRVAAAGLRIAEVPSVERSRMHGESNLRTFTDGARVLRTILTERHRSRRLSRAGLDSHPARRKRWLPPRLDLLDRAVPGVPAEEPA
ncbi:glycosyltransferase family 2 protein [Solihabitans fulvus]|uniref:Glycosyltransferase family 2 protein n=1 Tax=Solihabitans fulvus TaxID=1892852 RepID=A0A5B2XF76_9PSEU|nr:glycosyltransferase family 2 protein [Solihabitans fulvus]KAA2261705.1 glycosyltransferase family 2 protein [Solihabitans fulvus]